MQCVKQKIGSIDKKIIDELFTKNWVVYAKRPFQNVNSVIEYLGRYTHKIAINNHRIKAIADNKVTFSYKDYRKGASKQEMTLEAIEFIRRFSMLFLPKGFVRIRHYGILSSTSKVKCSEIIKLQIPVKQSTKKEPRNLKAYNPKICLHCETETMIQIEILPKRGPPKFNCQIQNINMVPIV